MMDRIFGFNPLFNALLCKPNMLPHPIPLKYVHIRGVTCPTLLPFHFNLALLCSFLLLVLLPKNGCVGM